MGDSKSLIPSSPVEIEAHVRKIISGVLELKDNDFPADSSFAEDLGADSLHKVEIIMSLENAFDLEIPADDTSSILCLKDAVEYIAKRSAIK